MKPNNLSIWYVAPDGVEIKETANHKYCCFISNLDICNDGVGVRVRSDRHQQARTAYTPFLNADTDLYAVLPPQMRRDERKPVLGSMGRVTNLVTKQTSWCVWGNVGPSSKTGEVSYALGKLLHDQVSRAPRMIGDLRALYFYECWPGVAAVVGKRTYHLINKAGRLVK
jgi:hypothetical protein